MRNTYRYCVLYCTMEIIKLVLFWMLFELCVRKSFSLICTFLVMYVITIILIDSALTLDSVFRCTSLVRHKEEVEPEEREMRLIRKDVVVTIAECVTVAGICIGLALTGAIVVCGEALLHALGLTFLIIAITSSLFRILE